MRSAHGHGAPDHPPERRSRAPAAERPEPMRPNAFVLLWSVTAIPSTAAAFASAGLVLAIIYPLGFDRVTFGPVKDAVLGGLSGGAWACIVALPHAALLRLYLSLTERFQTPGAHRASTSIAVACCAVPQAAILGALIAPPIGLVAWTGVTLGLLVPRFVVKRLAFAA